MKRILLFAAVLALVSLVAAAWLAADPLGAWEESSTTSGWQRAPGLDYLLVDTPTPESWLFNELRWQVEGMYCKPYAYWAIDSKMQFVRNVDSLMEFLNQEVYDPNPYNWEPREWTDHWDPSTRERVWTNKESSGVYPPEYLPTSITPSVGDSVILRDRRYLVEGRVLWCPESGGRRPRERYGWFLTNQENIVREWEEGVEGRIAAGDLWALYDEETGLLLHSYFREEGWADDGTFLTYSAGYLQAYNPIACFDAFIINRLSETSCDFSQPMPRPSVETEPTPTPEATTPPATPTVPLDETITPGTPTLPSDETVTPGTPVTPSDGTVTPGTPVTPSDETVTPGTPTAPPDETVTPGTPTTPPDQTVTPGTPTTPVGPTPTQTTPVAPTMVPPPPGAPDLMVRDNPTDDGRRPSSAPFWISPDIVVRNEKDGVLAHQDPIFGQTNYIYVRVHNIGTTQSKPFSVGFYWGNAATALLWPQSWHYIGSILVGSSQVGVPAGGQVWAGPLSWDPPARGHYCLLARIDSIEDPVVNEGAVTIENNLAQLNLNIVEKPEEGGDTEIEIVGPEGGLEDFVVVIIRFPQLPAGAHLTIYIDPSTIARWLEAGVEIEGAYLEGNALIPWEGAQEIRLAGLPLEPLEEVPFTFQVTGPPGSQFTIDVEQWVNDVLVGGTSFMTRAYYEQHVLPPQPPPAGSAFKCCIPWPMLGAAMLVGLAYAGSRRQ